MSLGSVDPCFLCECGESVERRVFRTHGQTFRRTRFKLVIQKGGRKPQKSGHGTRDGAERSGVYLPDLLGNTAESRRVESRLSK